MCPVDSRVVYDVVIIGAGISGLAAARILSRESFNILVLEARNRPGGRIHTVRMPAAPKPVAESSACNHDHLSVFHVNPRPSTAPSTCEGPESRTPSPTTPQSASSSAGQSPSDSCFSDPVDVDLGANYLIGCSNRQSDQPLFHLARLLKVPTAASMGDLCKKYRGWECAELSVWYNHLLPDAPRIPVDGLVADAVFLFDKVTHLATQYYLRNKTRDRKLQSDHCSSQSSPSSSVNSDGTTSTDPAIDDGSRPYDSVKMYFDQALKDILQSEAEHGIRPAPTFRDAAEEGVFQSVLTRYFAYVNPMERLPFSVMEELCETADSPADDASAKSARSGTSPRKNGRLVSLVDELATVYPTAAQREAYNLWAKRKLTALASGAAGCRPEVAKQVNVRWEDRLVAGRFSDLLAPLLEDVPVVYRAVVRDIDWSGCDAQAPVRIRARVTRAKAVDGEDSKRCNGCCAEEQEEDVVYRAKHCIISVPVGVLKGLDERSRIQFTPDLPLTKREAIDRLGMPYSGAATHDKVLLRFRAPEDVFWDAEAAHLQCPDSRLHILNLHRYGKPGVLCAHLWGGGGLSPTGRTDSEVVQVILDLLAAMYPRCTVPRPLSYLVTRWSEDPFALGAYTTGEPESQDVDRLTYAATLTSQDAFRLINDDQLTKGEDDSKSPEPPRTKPLSIPRLLFAGEGTLAANEAKECTHGALQTGVARAIELLPYLVLDSISKQAASSSGLDSSDDTRLFPDIPLHKLAHYLMGRADSRKLATNPNFNPLDTDDSNGVVDGFVVRRPKRCATVTARYSAAWPMTSTGSSGSSNSNEESEATSSRRKRVGATPRTVSQSRKRGRPRKDPSASSPKQAVCDRNAGADSETALLSRLSSSVRGLGERGQGRGPVNGKSERYSSAVVHVYGDHPRQDGYSAESASPAPKSKKRSKQPAGELNSTDVLLLNFQLIRDSWSDWNPADKQAVLGQLNLLLSELQSHQLRGGTRPPDTVSAEEEEERASRFPTAVHRVRQTSARE